MIDIGERIETSCQLTYPPGKSGDIQFLLKDNPKSNWCRCRGLAEDSADGEGSVTADSRQPTGLRMGSMMKSQDKDDEDVARLPTLARCGGALNFTPPL